MKWKVAAFAGNLLLSSFLISKVSVRLPVMLARLRAAFNWVSAKVLRGGTTLSRVILGLTVSAIIRIQTAVAPSSLFIHTSHMIARPQPDIKSSAILVDGGGTDFMTNSMEGIIGNLARVEGESVITVAGPKALENCALFRKVVYGTNGNSVTVQTKMWYDPTLRFDIYGLAALRKLLGAIYIDANDPINPTTSAILRLSSAENMELELGRTENGLEWLSYDAPEMTAPCIWLGEEALAMASMMKSCISTLYPVTMIGTLNKCLLDYSFQPTVGNAGHIFFECTTIAKRTTLRGLSVALLAIQECDIYSAHEIGLANSWAGL